MKLIFIFIILLSFTTNGAIISTNKSSITTNQFVTRKEWNKWVREMNYWFSQGAEEELYNKVASYSEIRGIDDIVDKGNS